MPHKRNVPELTKKLQAYQYENGMTDAEFAEELGMSKENWTKIKNGKRGYGSMSIKAVLNWNRLPDLLELILQLKDDKRERSAPGNSPAAN